MDKFESFAFVGRVRMIVIIFLDDKKGMMFNGRRQSRDKAVTKRIQKLCEGKKLWMNTYSGKLYGSLEGVYALVDDDFLSLADKKDFCLIESENLKPFAENIDKIIVYWWNRAYPADVHLDLDLSQWEKKEQYEFQGRSHEKIVEEIYEKEGFIS